MQMVIVDLCSDDLLMLYSHGTTLMFLVGQFNVISSIYFLEYVM